MLRKVMLVFICTLLVLFSCPFTTFAYNNTNEIANDTTVKLVTTISITDPDTGEIWESEVDTDEIFYSSNYALLLEEEDTETAFITFNLRDYILLADPSISTTKEDDITITAGMKYNISGSNVKIIDVFGSTVNNGLFYASNREFYWRHPGTGEGGSYYPTTSSWNYNVNSNYGLYESRIPPKTILDCRINVSGMTAYKDISVTCTLSP